MCRVFPKWATLSRVIRLQIFIIFGWGAVYSSTIDTCPFCTKCFSFRKEAFTFYASVILIYTWWDSKVSNETFDNLAINCMSTIAYREGKTQIGNMQRQSERGDNPR
jgi:hypothetical protein